MLYSSGQVATPRALSRLHIVIFSKLEISRRQVARGSPERTNVHETVGRKSNCKLNFFSMYFVRNNEEIHLSFKNNGNKL